VRRRIKPEIVCSSTVVATCVMAVGVTVDGSTAAVFSPVHKYFLTWKEPDDVIYQQKSNVQVFCNSCTW